MGKILLFHVNTFQATQIESVCKALGHTLIQVPMADYGKPIGVLAGFPGMRSKAVYGGEELEKEMMVMAGLDSKALDAFLEGYKAAGIPPIPRKAVLTSANSKWNVSTLYADLSEHVAQTR